MLLSSQQLDYTCSLIGSQVDYTCLGACWSHSLFTNWFPVPVDRYLKQIWLGAARQKASTTTTITTTTTTTTTTNHLRGIKTWPATNK